MYRHSGKFEMANGGTLFLDEIGTISPKVQVELLRVLEEKVVTRVGGRSRVPVDFRVVAATNEDLDERVRQGDFREDLFWRLNVFTIEMPSLRERPEDIGPLAEFFLDRFTRIDEPQAHALLGGGDARAAKLFLARQRARTPERHRARGRGGKATLHRGARFSDARDRVAGTGAGGARSLAEVERSHVLAVLEAEDWNISRAARDLEIDRGTLYHKIEKYGLDKAKATG